MIKNIVNLGDAAIYCDFGSEVNQETNLKVINYFNVLKEVSASAKALCSIHKIIMIAFLN